MHLKHLLILGLSVLPVASLHAATVDGVIDTNSGAEYQWDTNGVEGSDKWHTRGGNKEFNDASGGDDYDINYLGVNVENNQYQLGVVGGKVLEGNAPYNGHDYFLSDIAINVVTPGEIVTDPTLDSSGWDYALRLVNINDGAAIAAGTQDAVFDLYALSDGNTTGSWDRAGKTEGTPHSYSSTDTFKMNNGHLVQQDIAGLFTNNGGDDNVLEVSFDLSLLGLFDAITGGEVITYLTIACVNDEALVHANVSPVPVPAAFWLFGSALIGFIGFSRRTNV